MKSIRIKDVLITKIEEKYVFKFRCLRFLALVHPDIPLLRKNGIRLFKCFFERYNNKTKVMKRNAYCYKRFD
ncbi:hypothetical protein KZO01_22830 [Kurthia zopfii]|nr:hypothetical protein DF281_12980 [Kurthia zopfii]GEK31974.1 hypothetical protein KZO01_22830 [Kurthia zopfii]